LVRFEETKTRPMGRTASGVRGITLKDETDEVIGMVTVDKEDINDSQILVVTENGYGKRTKLVDEDGEDVYRITNRGGKGVKTLNITEKTGKLISISAVTDADDLMIINKSGLTIRMAIEDLRVMGRATQGVKLINLKGNDSIAAVTKVMKDDVVEVVVDEDGNVIESEVIERVKPVLEVLEDDGAEDEEEDDDDIEEEEEDDAEESDDDESDDDK
jgi:DNA gyrase subunit A